ADGKLEVTSDRLGAYPLYATEVGGVRLVSNNAEALRAARGGSSMAAPVLASLLGGGWSLSGDPVWEGIDRIAPARPSPAPGSGFDADRAASILIAAVRALGEWPGRPSVVPLTGGRDSRLVLGAALAAGIDFQGTTGGEPGHPDVEIGRELARVAGVPWSLVEHDPHGSVLSDWRRAAELLRVTTGGTASLSDAAGFPFGPRSGPLPLWHSGQGGEIARSYYGTGGDADRLYRAFVGRRPGRIEILGAEGQRLVRAQIDAFVEEQLDAGIAPADLPDMFYLERRMGTWAGPGHGAVEYVRDTTSPLWSRRLLPDMLGLPAEARARYEFHQRVLERLAPQLVDIPFEDGRGWPAREGELARRLHRGRDLARKARAELRRRMGRSGAQAGDDPFARVLPEVRDAVLSQPDHEAWHVLDRPRVEALLASDPVTLDTMSRYYAWRLATVFGPSA
ncbi:MAG: hypothetical protein QOF55_1957, partial [Thermoleophilaceae bacterium]|nr:hypothetical protein [Thermoleophilaceae bacterium]